MCDLTVGIMFLFAICFISFIISIIYCIGDVIDNNTEKDNIIAWISTSTLVLSCTLFVVGLCKVDSAEWVVEKDPYSVEQIVALNDNNLTEGRLYLRHGYFEEGLYYQYVVKHRSGGYVTNKVKSKNAILYYTDNNFRVEWYRKRKHWLFFERTETCNRIYIPEGSITEEYSVDLN